MKQKAIQRKRDIAELTQYLKNLGKALEDKERDDALYYVPPEICAQAGLPIEIPSDAYGSILFANDNIDNHDEKGDGSLLQKNNMDNKPNVNKKEKKRGKPSKKGKKNKNRRNRGKKGNDKALKKQQDDKKDNDDEEDWDEMFNWLHVQQ